MAGTTDTAGGTGADGIAATADVTATVHNGRAGKAIGRDLWGVFLEDINYAVDGGLNAQLVQNGAFEYDRADDPHWSHLTGWAIGHTGEGGRDVSVLADAPLAAENPHHLAVRLRGVTTIANRGFDGMTLRAGTRYLFSAWVRANGADADLSVDLVDGDGIAGDVANGAAPDDAVLAHAATVVRAGADGMTEDDADAKAGERRRAHGGWTRVTLPLDCAKDTGNGVLRIAVSAREPGVNANTDATPRLDLRADSTPHASDASLDLDFTSLRPCDPATGEPLLFRADLLDALRDLAPRFMRFPGGCITHGLGVDNMYRWKRTIGPVERRPHQFNLWGYHQSFEIGFHEYFLLCEALGAKPVPILPVGVSCQNTPGGVTTVPIGDMDGIVRDALDLIEYATGPVDSPWGAKRAAAGHPEPFDLEYLGLGNEDSITPAFRERFTLVADAVKARYPGVTVIGTVGPTPAGRDFDEGWRFAREYGVDMVDEHAYKSPQWWFSHLDHYDDRDGGAGADRPSDHPGKGDREARRSSPRIYLGEYGSWSNMQLSALAEAAIMTSIERNGNVVRMASYAPLFGRVGHTQWKPDLIYFDGGRVMRTANYWVQRMFARSACTRRLDTSVDGAPRHTPAPRDHTGLSFATGPGNTFAIDDIRIIPRDQHDQNSVTAPPIRLGEGATSVDTGLDVTADAYRVECTVRRLTGQDGMSVDFGATDGPDHFRWAFGDWGDKYMILKRVGDGVADEAVQAVEGGVAMGETYHVGFDVDHRGEHVSVDVNGRRVHEYRDDREETRFVVASGRDEDSGSLVVRVVNATGDAHTVALGFDEPPAPDADATIVTLAAPWDAGEPFEESRTTPTTRHARVSDLTRLAAPPYSLTVVSLPDPRAGGRSAAIDRSSRMLDD